MKLVEALAQLSNLGVKVSPNTLKRWAYTEKVIPKPSPTFTADRASGADWSTDLVEEAVAVWAVRQSTHERLSKKMIDVIRFTEQRVYWDGYAIYVIPPLGISLKHPSEIPYKSVRLQFVSEDFEDLSCFRGSSNKEKAATVSSLVITWLASRLKWRYTIKQEDRGLSDTWPITKPARVHISWGHPRKAFDQLFVMIKGKKYSVYAELSEADRDEIVLEKNGVDNRKLLFGLDRDGGKKKRKTDQ